VCAGATGYVASSENPFGSAKYTVRSDPSATAETVEQLLVDRGVEHVTYSGWEAIDAEERGRGEPHGRPRVKLVTWDELRAAARSIAAT